MRSLLHAVRVGRGLGRRFLLAAVVGAAAAGSAIGLAATSAWLISRAAQQPVMLTLLAAITAVRAFGIGRGVLRYAERLAAHDAAFRVLGRLRTAAYARMARIAPAGLAELRSGDLVARLVDDVDGLADLWLRVLLPAGAAILSVGGAVVLEAWLLPEAGIVLLVSALAVTAVAPAAAAAAARGAEARLSPGRGELAAAVVDVLRGAPEILAAGASGVALAGVRARSASLAAAERDAAAGAGIASLVAGLAASAAVLLPLALGVVAVEQGRLDGVALAVVVLLPVAVHEAIAPLAPAARLIPRLAASARRLHEVLARPDPVPEPSRGVSAPPGPLGLRIRGLAVRYPGAAAPALAPLDLDLPPGGRLVISGPSGSGKSTLAAACVRFVHPEAGSIQLIAGDAPPLDTAALQSDDVRMAVGLCEQDPHVFDATLADNLRLARPGAPDAELEAALAAARLLDWVETLPDGLATWVGERGGRLSGGQRQRLALARALLGGARLVVLDEPTEHLDEATARAFVADLPRALEGRTVLVLTHRPDLFDSSWLRGPDLRPVAPMRPAVDPRPRR